MNEFKAPPPDESSDNDANNENNDSIHMELLRARSRQRRFYLLLTLILFAGMILTTSLISFSNGTLINVQPEQAQESAAVKVLGALGGSIGSTVYSLFGNPTIEVSATGFNTLRKTLLDSETGGTLSIKLSEIPQLLRVTTKPDSEKTRWSVDGNMVAKAKQLQQKLFSGEHAIEIDNPYFKKQRINVVMQPGKGLDRSVDLQPISGQMNISTTPPGASVHINGDEIGLSPVSVKKPGGQYHLEIALGSYQTISEDVEITNTEMLIERDYRLAASKAYVSLHLSPVGGVLLLNGKKVPSPAGKLAVKARTNNMLSYHKPGYFSQQQTVSISPGTEKEISFHLKPETGVVDVRSKPAATVLIDGKQVGRTPLILTLSAIPHHIELRKRGYRSHKQTLTPDSKSRQTITAVLRTESQARLAETPQTYTNSVGMRLKLFRPRSSFVMGAPRYEKGQRANEFLRTVKLTRAFYIGKYEVTGAQFARFRRGKGKKGTVSLFRPEESKLSPLYQTAPFLLPARSVSWIEAAQFCNWLSAQEKLKPFYNIRNGQYAGFNATSDGYRLPSEAEWEWLARKAGKAKQSKFTWGNATTIPENSGNIADETAKGTTTHYVPNYSDGYAGLAPVGSYPAEKSGLYDLTGNVSEWVHDVYTLVPPVGQTTELDPLGQNSGDTHTVKGSNWRSGTITELRASYREGANTGRDDIGFRVARYID